jgi:hypothetical protein
MPAFAVKRSAACVLYGVRPTACGSSLPPGRRVGVTPPMDERNLEALGLLRGAFISRQTRAAVMEVDVLVPGGDGDEYGELRRHESAPPDSPDSATSCGAGADNGRPSEPDSVDINGSGGAAAGARRSRSSMLHGPTFKEMHERGMLSVDAAATIEAGLTALTGARGAIGGGPGQAWTPDVASKAASLRLRLNLGRSEMLSGVLEVDGQGEVVNVAHPQLHQAGGYGSKT